jgi:CRP-like cAMP-binding protein
MQFHELVRSVLKEINLDEVVTIQPQHCESYADLLEIYRQDMSVTKSFEDCMSICAAVHLAVPLEGEPLWFYLVGRPSGGKSTLCDLLMSDEIHSFHLSKFTGLVSGNRQGKPIIPLMQGKCVIIPDGTLLFESTPIQLANVYGELRGIFDGNLNVEYRNGVSASFSNISFGMIIGITERIYALTQSALGERFLHCRLDTSRDTEVQRNMNAIDSIFNDIGLTNFEGNEAGDMRSFPKQRAYTAGFLSRLHAKIRSGEIVRPRYTTEDKMLIQAIADMVACSRAQAPRGKENNVSEVLYDSKPEGTTRVAKLLSILAVCLCYVHGVSEITPLIRSLLVKVGLDTAASAYKQYAIIRAVSLSDGLTKTAIANLTGITIETVSRRVEDLISLGILLPDIEKDRAVRGRAVPTLMCTQWIRQAFRLVEKHVQVPNSQDHKAAATVNSAGVARNAVPISTKRQN